MTPKPSAEREAARRSRGRAVSIVLTDADALKVLQRLERKHGGPKAAITWALIQSKGIK